MLNSTYSIAVIGAGHLGQCIIHGLIHYNIPASQIQATIATEGRCQELTQALGVRVSTDNLMVIKQADIVLLALKPKNLPALLQEVSAAYQEKQLWISFAAGIRLHTFYQYLPKDSAIVRVMPNSAASVGESVSAMFASEVVTTTQKKLAEQLMTCVGTALWVAKEEDIDVATAIASSGAAYFYYLAECLSRAGEYQGLNREASLELIRQTVIGVGAMLSQTFQPFEKLRAQITSPGGTTEQAIQSLKQAEFGDIVQQAVARSIQKANELSGLPHSDSSPASQA